MMAIYLLSLMILITVCGRPGTHIFTAVLENYTQDMWAIHFVWL